MNRATNYKTKQREAILNYIISLHGNHVTAAQIVEHFDKEDVSIGRTTVFRHLEKLSKSGKIRRYITDGISGACYQNVSNGEDCHSHLHLKCEGCKELLHLKCETFSELENHVFDKHAFQVNALKTVLYGKCDVCLQKA